jgi:hypothetical protein
MTVSEILRSVQSSNKIPVLYAVSSCSAQTFHISNRISLCGHNGQQQKKFVCIKTRK